MNRVKPAQRRQASDLPKVSVCVITYNQEIYIGQCLQSIVDQQTDFDFEVIVGDDASTDATPAVVQQFADRYPQLVRPIYQAQNIGAGARNFRVVHLAARGRYVAHVDGDDYILPGKLQAQVDVLDADPQIAFATHSMAQDIDEQCVFGDSPAYPERGDVYDLLRLGAYFAHSSVMYRRDSGGVEGFPEDAVDFYMHFERAMHGDIFLDKRVFGRIRALADGISQHPRYTARTERSYEATFDRALALGLDRERVEAARLDRRMKFAIARCLAGDSQGYREVVRLADGDWRLASHKHRVLHLTRRFPFVVSGYFIAKALKARLMPQTRRDMK